MSYDNYSMSVVPMSFVPMSVVPMSIVPIFVPMTFVPMVVVPISTVPIFVPMTFVPIRIVVRCASRFIIFVVFLSNLTKPKIHWDETSSNRIMTIESHLSCPFIRNSIIQCFKNRI